MNAFFQTLFDAVYLCTVTYLGIRLLKESRGRRQYVLYGAMALVLGFGDAFHLIPRMIALCTDSFDRYQAMLGIGKWITSITMTVFYLLLYEAWRTRYSIKGRRFLSGTIWGLTAFRIILCLFPQNEWLAAEPSYAWGIYRNIPFLILGVINIVLFFHSAHKTNDRAFQNLWLTIVLSFSFYLPVVLFVHKIPELGLLMIPKTCAYIWTILIGYRAMKKETPTHR